MGACEPSVVGRLIVQAVQTDVDEFSVEAEVSGFGTCQSWTWFCRTDDDAWIAAAAWAEGVAAAADWAGSAPEIL